MEKQDAVILEARKEVQGHVNMFLVTPILSVFDEIYMRAMSIDGHIVTFQKALKEIPHWTTHTVSQCCDRIQKSCDFLPQLITALFLSHIKILSSIKITKISHIRIKVPKREKFLHAVLIESAKAFYEDPLMFRRRDTEKKRNAVMTSIDSIVRRFLPLKDVLDAYLMNKASNLSDASDDEDQEMDTPIEDVDEVSSVQNLKQLIEEEEEEEVTTGDGDLPYPPPMSTPVAAEETQQQSQAAVTPKPAEEKIIHIESATAASSEGKSKRSRKKISDGMMFYRDADVKDRAKI